MENYVAVDSERLDVENIDEFIEALKKANEEKRGMIFKKGSNTLIYVGGNPAELNPPPNFTWAEEEKEFNNLAAHLLIDGKSICQYFRVKTGFED